MKKKLVILVILLAGCSEPNSSSVLTGSRLTRRDVYRSIMEIPPPDGYHRVVYEHNSFMTWLRKLPLKSDKTVYLYNGDVKHNQAAQFAVLDISTGKKDLQQCADAVMRLRAEYLFSENKFDSILFTDFSGKKYQWTGVKNRHSFDLYLENVFGRCGSASLEKQLRSVPSVYSMQAGDVFIKGGFPGHAVIVADMAENEKGEKVYMLVQGYQPAQDMHVLINPADNELSPWYRLNNEDTIKTPEWWFSKKQLRRW